MGVLSARIQKIVATYGYDKENGFERDLTPVPEVIEEQKSQLEKELCELANEMARCRIGLHELHIELEEVERYIKWFNDRMEFVQKEIDQRNKEMKTLDDYTKCHESLNGTSDKDKVSELAPLATNDSC